MTAKIIEVLAKILEGLGKNHSYEQVSKILSKEKKFNKQTISAAFSWLHDRKITARSISLRRKNSENRKFRVLLDEEKEVLGSENYNYLMYLLNIGLISPSDLNSILEQIMLYPDEEITKEAINWIIHFSLADPDDKYLPGSRYMLYSSDTIN